MNCVKPFPTIYELGDNFYDPVKAANFAQLKLRYQNQDIATWLGSDSPDLLQKHLGRFEPLANNLTHPLALRYHGHQFRHYNPDLGDGRGFLFAQFQSNAIHPHIPSSNNFPTLWDLGTKGSGQTPYSRQGDGRLTLKGAYREALATELLESLGVFTSRTFCFFETEEKLERNDEPSPTRAAVLTRLSNGHIRIGTFQRLAYFKEALALKKMTFYCLKHYYPEILANHQLKLEDLDEINLSQITEIEQKKLAADFLEQVCKRLARLSAQYMMSGFVHGVLNTDNINITGESFDYGPYRFLPKYDPQFTAAYFDQQGLYCYGRQPSAIFWNLQHLAQCLEWAFAGIESETILKKYSSQFTDYILSFFCKRLNIKKNAQSAEQLQNLLALFFQFCSQSQIPFEQAFFDLAVNDSLHTRLLKSPFAKLYQSPLAIELIQELNKQQSENEYFLTHPYFNNDSACSLLIEEIENIWSLIAEHDDWSSFNKKLSTIRAMRGVYQLTD